MPCHLDPSHIFLVKALALSEMSVKQLRFISNYLRQITFS